MGRRNIVKSREKWPVFLLPYDCRRQRSVFGSSPVFNSIVFSSFLGYFRLVFFISYCMHFFFRPYFSFLPALFPCFGSFPNPVFSTSLSFPNPSFILLPSFSIPNQACRNLHIHVKSRPEVYQPLTTLKTSLLTTSASPAYSEIPNFSARSFRSFAARASASLRRILLIFLRFAAFRRQSPFLSNRVHLSVSICRFRVSGLATLLLGVSYLGVFRDNRFCIKFLCNLGNEAFAPPPTPTTFSGLAFLFFCKTSHILWQAPVPIQETSH